VVATGTFVTDTFDATLVHTDGVSGAAYYDYVLTGHYTGDLTGFEIGTGHFVQFGDGSGVFEEKDVITSATLGGRTGEITGVSHGTVNTAGGASGRESDSGSGGLAGLHLEGPYVQSCSSCPQTYALNYHFGP
jgi:hypothetical protein